MSQTVKISAGYSDKNTENYNSTQYSLNLELDVVVNGSTSGAEFSDVQLQLRQLWRASEKKLPTG
jgi:hypothetical protein